jgi:hypothetical protein
MSDNKTLTIKNHPNCPKCGSKNTKIIPQSCPCTRTWEGPTCWSAPYCEDCYFTGYANSEGIYWYEYRNLKDNFLNIIKSQEKLNHEDVKRFKEYKLSEIAMSITIRILRKLHSSPDNIVLTADNGIQLRFYIDNRDIELEIFEDGDIVFSEDDDVKDIQSEQLDEVINILNKWIDEYE